jgi:hypothetical protein
MILLGGRNDDSGDVAKISGKHLIPSLPGFQMHLSPIFMGIDIL